MEECKEIKLSETLFSLCIQCYLCWWLLRARKCSQKNMKSYPIDLKLSNSESLIYLFIKIRVIKGCRYFTQEQNSKPLHFLYPPDNWSNQDHLQNNLGSGRFIWKHVLDSAFPPKVMSKKQSTSTPSWCFCTLQCERLSGFNTYCVEKEFCASYQAVTCH